MINCIIGFLFFIFVMTGYSLVLRKYIYSRFLPFFITAAFTCIGYFGLLTRTWCVILPLMKIGGCACVGFAVFQMIKGNDKFRSCLHDTFREQFFFFLMAGLLCFSMIFMECIPGAYDNFNHWLLYPKYILLNGRLGRQAELTHYLN